MLELKLVNVDTGEIIEVNEDNYKFLDKRDPFFEYGYVITDLLCNDFNMDLKIHFYSIRERVFTLEKIVNMFDGFKMVKRYREMKNCFLSEFRKSGFKENPSPMKFYNLAVYRMA